MSAIAVITTINPPCKSTRILRDSLEEEGIPLLVVGDRKGPSSYTPCSEFLHIDAQRRLPYALAGALPEGHYCRKNLGYLRAFELEASVIYETDDDNHPISGKWKPLLEPYTPGATWRHSGWFNVYRHFTEASIWPRGLPLDHIHDRGAWVKDSTAYTPIRQGLANGSPDVDAVWRLVMDQEITFRERSPVFLSRGTWCPFNSQNTWWSREVFPLLYLPAHVSFRMTDIWRSFVAQYCVWAIGGQVAFFSADVFQSRNQHNLMQDFADEVSGYLHNIDVVQALCGTSLASGLDAVGSNLRLCYVALVEKGLLPSAELPLLDAWLADCALLLPTV